MRLRRNPLFVETLEDRTTPAGLVDALATATPILDAPVQAINVVSAGESGAMQSALSAAPFASSVKHVGFGIYNITLTSGIEPSAAASFYSTLPGVVAAEPDYVIQVQRTPNDTQYSSLYGMAQIGAPTAWDTSVGSGNFVVAVIDSGVDYNHPDLAANMWHNPNETPGDGIDNDGNGIVDDYYGANFVGTNSGNPMDDNGHGTHVAGTIGAIGNNGLGVVGVNWNVKIMALKFLSASGSGSTSDAVEALNYAVAHGVKVSNNSWGGGGYSATLFNAIQAASNAGHIFVAAAGNSNVNIDTTPSYPASYNVANVVAVAATTNTDVRASYSNFGASTVDIAAPGSGIISTTPNNTYSNYSGTSMATPHVAGAIALYWDSHSTDTAAQVIAKLTSSADVLTSLSGLVNGGRRLNVARMMEGTSPPPPPSDTTGARVTAASFTGTTSLSAARFTFNEAINPASFTASDVVFTGPAGAISISSVAVVSGTGNTQFDVTFPTQTAAGTYTMTIGPAILDAAGNAMDQNPSPANGEATADRFTTSRTLTSSGTTTFTGGGLPLAIRDLQYTRATINVNQDITISDLNVRFSATHTYDSDLIVRLYGPGGQVATLVNRRGGSANHFTNTVLDDEASVSIASGAAPFIGTFRPETSLTTFDGRNARGTWTLEIYDAANLDTGSLTAWSLTITGTNGSQSVTAFGMKQGDPFTERAAEAELPSILAPIALPPEPVRAPRVVSAPPAMMWFLAPPRSVNDDPLRMSVA